MLNEKFLPTHPLNDVCCVPATNAGAVGVMSGYFWQLYRTGWHWGITGADPNYAIGSLYQRQASTMVFLGIIIMQVANLFSCRTERASVFHVGFFSNPLVFVGIAFELAFAAAIIYIPFLQRIFGTAPIDLAGWLVLAAFTPVVFFLEEARKAIVRRRQSRTPIKGRKYESDHRRLRPAGFGAGR